MGKLDGETEAKAVVFRTEKMKHRYTKENTA
jgi:hypothetical protein